MLHFAKYPEVLLSIPNALASGCKSLLFDLRRLVVFEDADVPPTTETHQDVREDGVNPSLPRNCERIARTPRQQ